MIEMSIEQAAALYTRLEDPETMAYQDVHVPDWYEMYIHWPPVVTFEDWLAINNIVAYEEVIRESKRIFEGFEDTVCRGRGPLAGIRKRVRERRACVGEGVAVRGEVGNL